MTIELVLNELSLHSAASSVLVARERMNRLVRTIVAAVNAGASRSIRLNESLEGVQLAPGYVVAQWRNDDEVSRELRTYFRSVTSKAPLLQPSDTQDLFEQHGRSEFSMEGRPAVGLGTALLLDALALSINSKPEWDIAWIKVRRLFLEEEGSLSEELADVRHASNVAHISQHENWLSGRESQVRDSADLWARREQLFPSLRFCAAVQAQLAQVDPGGPLLKQILKRLITLDFYFRDWDGSSFDPKAIPMKLSTESEATMAQYSQDRTFVDPDGQERVFAWHARLTPGAWRLYFEPEGTKKKGLIGYIGPKPPCVTYS